MSGGKARPAAMHQYRAQLWALGPSFRRRYREEISRSLKQGAEASGAPVFSGAADGAPDVVAGESADERVKAAADAAWQVVLEESLRRPDPWQSCIRAREALGLPQGDFEFQTAAWEIHRAYAPAYDAIAGECAARAAAKNPLALFRTNGSFAPPPSYSVRDRGDPREAGDASTAAPDSPALQSKIAPGPAPNGSHPTARKRSSRAAKDGQSAAQEKETGPVKPAKGKSRPLRSLDELRALVVKLRHRKNKRTRRKREGPSGGQKDAPTHREKAPAAPRGTRGEGVSPPPPRTEETPAAEAAGSSKKSLAVRLTALSSGGAFWYGSLVILADLAEARCPRRICRHLFLGLLREHTRLRGQAALDAASRLESGCYNSVIAQATATGDVIREWKAGGAFEGGLYATRCGVVADCLDPAVYERWGGVPLCALLESGQLEPETAGAMSAEELCAGPARPLREKISQRLRSKVEERASALYKCPACGKRRHTLEQRQTRSLDEPATIICRCLECGMQFRR